MDFYLHTNDQISLYCFQAFHCDAIMGQMLYQFQENQRDYFSNDTFRGRSLITIRQQKVVEGNKDDDDSKDRLEPWSHKDKPEYVDDDDKGPEKVDEEEGGEMGSLETRTEKMQTPIPTPPRSPWTILSLDMNIT
ncbi:hypothetical protein Tco_1532809 [Tanacetum coccineum]